MKVRAAEPTDTPALLALRSALWPEREVRHLEQELSRRADSRPRTETLLAEDEAGVVCGFADLTRVPGELPIVMLNAVFVAPPARRRGAAASLLVAAERWAHSRGAGVLVCEVDPAGESQQEALSWLGFAVHEVRIRLHRPVSAPMDIPRGASQETLPPGDEVSADAQPVLTMQPARSVWFVVFNAALAVAAAASFSFTDIYSSDVLRGVFLPLLDAAFFIYFIFLFLMLRYRKQANSSARADRLFSNDP